MKKLITSVVLSIASLSLLHAQGYKKFHDDFESYTVSSWLGVASPVWTTWSNSPGPGGDDVQVTNTDARSGTKSIYFTPGPGPEDVVLPFGGEYSWGQFLFTAYFKIPTSKDAYFNFQANSTTGVTWAVEVYLQTTGAMVFSNLTSGTMFSTSYPQGKWFEVKIYINLSTNTWHVFVDNTYRGYFSNSVNQVASLDLYPVDGSSSFWVDDVSFIYAPPSPNNAGLRGFTAPLVPPSCGNHAVKVNVVNNGNNKLDSVRVYWTLDGVAQPTVFVTTPIDTLGSSSGNTLQVTLGNSVSFGSTPRVIKAWTAYPNGVIDTLNFEDTIQTTIKAVIGGVQLNHASPFQGRSGSGSMAAPDTVCVGDTITYGITPPTGYTKSDFGTGWKISDLQIKAAGTPPVDTLTLPPDTSANARVRYVADTSEAGKLFRMDIKVELISLTCDTVITHYFYVAPRPFADFTVVDTCDGAVVNFNNNSTSQGTMTYNWDFGNGTSSTFQNPLRVYPAGNYLVTLKVKNSFGCNASVAKPLQIFPKPVANYTAVNACAKLPIQFTDSSTIDTGSIVSYFWEFGQGATSTLQNPSRTYNTAGAYNVKLTVVSDKGCQGQVTKQVEAYEIPVADFVAANSCVTDSVAFIDKSTPSSGLTYRWNFGGGDTSNLQNPMHKYKMAATFLAQLQVITPYGCNNTLGKQVEIYPAPVANYTVSGGHCFGDTTFFKNTSTISSGGVISTYSWNFGDGNSASGTDISHFYAAPGQYGVSFKVTSDKGCFDTMNTFVDIYEVPVADFMVSDGCFGPATAFANKSSIGSGDTITFSWQLGDGNGSTDLDPLHNYTSAGIYNVELIARSGKGCSDTIVYPVEIFPVPDADFSAGDVCDGDTTIFNNLSTSLSDTMKFDWSFGDGMNATEMSPKHFFTGIGTYDVMLHVTTEHGCMDSMMKTVEVFALPDDSFTRIHIGNGVYEFTPTVTGLTSYNWDFGDGTTTTGSGTVKHQYADFGTYKVKLTVRNSNGCESIYEETVEYATGIGDKPQVPQFIRVYPNPYKESTNIVYQLEQVSSVMIEIYSMEGKLVKRLANNEIQLSGEHRYTFSGKESGIRSGSFFIRFTIDGETYMKQMVQLR